MWRKQTGLLGDATFIEFVSRNENGNYTVSTESGNSYINVSPADLRDKIQNDEKMWLSAGRSSVK